MLQLNANKECVITGVSWYPQVKIGHCGSASYKEASAKTLIISICRCVLSDLSKYNIPNGFKLLKAFRRFDQSGHINTDGSFSVKAASLQ